VLTHFATLRISYFYSNKEICWCGIAWFVVVVVVAFAVVGSGGGGGGGSNNGVGDGGGGEGGGGSNTGVGDGGGGGGGDVIVTRKIFTGKLIFAPIINTFLAHHHYIFVFCFTAIINYCLMFAGQRNT
jgi:hypothetical protein